VTSTPVIDRVSATVERPPADVAHRHIARHGAVQRRRYRQRREPVGDRRPRPSGPPDGE